MDDVTLPVSAFQPGTVPHVCVRTGAPAEPREIRVVPAGLWFAGGLVFALAAPTRGVQVHVPLARQVAVRRWGFGALAFAGPLLATVVPPLLGVVGLLAVPFCVVAAYRAGPGLSYESRGAIRVRRAHPAFLAALPETLPPPPPTAYAPSGGRHR
jgi:hypothetical protein